MRNIGIIGIIGIGLIGFAMVFSGCGGGGGGTTPDEGGEVIGRVIGATTGLPIAGATVTVNGQVKVTTAFGEFSYTGLPTTVTTGTVQLAGYETATFTFDPPTEADPSDAGDILMVVAQPVNPPPGPYTVWGTVQLSGGADPAGTIVEVVGETDTYTVAIGDNEYYLWLPPGTYTIRATHAGYTAHTVSGVQVVDVEAHVRQDFSLAP